MLEEKEKRQKRIQEKIRNYKKWRRYAKECGLDQEWTDRTARRGANHGKLCSCHMCGNQRRFQRGATKLTQQERNSLIRLKESMFEEPKEEL